MKIKSTVKPIYPCPVVMYEWQIQRLDGLVVQQWLDVGGLYFFLLK
jgi:hypothetical protein